jgi:hypothetical protein
MKCIRAFFVDENNLQQKGRGEEKVRRGSV